MDYQPLLKKAGVVLVVVGLIDLALMVVAIMSSVSYSSSLNVFAVVAGVFLIKGSLRAAAIVRQFALFFVATMVAAIVLASFFLPLGLLATQFQLNPLLYFGSFAFALLALGLFLWLIRVLGSPEVLHARQEAGLPRRSSYVALSVGVGLAVVLAATSYFVQHSAFAARAMSEARSALGDEYNFYVSSLSSRTTSEGTSVAGAVTAWKSGSIKVHRFSWRE